MSVILALRAALAKVGGVDPFKRDISLGRKETPTNPWEVFADKHPKGTMVKGEVTNKTEFGLFIGLEGDVNGVVQLCDLDWDRPGELVLDEYAKGEMVKAVVLHVDPEKEHISLGIKQMAGVGAVSRVSAAMERAQALLDTYLQKGPGVDFSREVRRAIESDSTDEVLLSGALALERDIGFDAAMKYCEEIHRVVLSAGRDELVGIIMLVQADILHRADDGMRQSLYAIEAASAFIDHGQLAAATAAIELMST